MIEPVTINLPVPPSANNLYANRKRGRYKTTSYKHWISAADGYFLAQRKRIAVEHVQSPCVLEIKIPRGTRGDVSNRIKAVEDFLVRVGMTDDDRTNHKVSIERADVTCCVVTLSTEGLAA